jgi:hypothetical protein
MAETFLSVWRSVLQYNRRVPATLCRTWVRQRYEQILDRRMWSFQWGHGCWNVKAPITGNATIVAGSNVLTFGAGVLPGDKRIVGWEVMINGQIPYYMVVDADATTVTLDRICVETSASNVPCQISMVYFMSEQPDFEKMIAIVDRQNNWQFRLNVSIEEMDNDDPQRSTVSPPTRMVPLGFNDQYLAMIPDSVTDCYGQENDSQSQPFFETWPRASTAQPYPYVYKRKTPSLANDGDPLPGFIRGRALFEGALADLCSWPGTQTNPNPANPVQANVHERKFEDAVFDMINRDEQVSLRSLTWARSYRNFAFAELESARYRQSHVDASLVLQKF